MDLRAIDRLVAEHVLGWTDIDRKMSGYCPDGNGGFYWRSVPFYCADMEPAWEVMHAMKHWHPKLSYCDVTKGWTLEWGMWDARVPFWRYEDVEKGFHALPLLICTSALKAKGVEVPG